MAADTEQVEICFEEAEDSNTKFKEIKLENYCQGKYTVNDMFKWGILKDVLRENLLKGSWHDTSDEYTIIAVIPIYNTLKNVFKIVNFSTFSIDAPDVESRNKLKSKLRDKLTSELQSELADGYRQSKQKEVKQNREENKETFNNFFTYFNERNRLLDICLKLNELFEGEFTLKENLSRKYDPHLRMSVSDEDEADRVVKQLNGYALEAIKGSKGSDFIVIVKGVKDMEKFQFAIDEGIKKNNSDQKSCCVVM